MSKFTALIATLLLGSSSVALADTSLSFTGSAQASWGSSWGTAPTVRDHRVATTSYRPWSTAFRGTWISLAEPMTGNATLRLQSQAQLDQIRIQSASGASYISTVSVRFADGSRQQLTLNRWIDARNPMLQFSLDRTARVDAILINGSTSGRRGSYQVFGYGTRTAESPMPPVYQPPVYQPRGVLLGTDMSFVHTDGRRFLTVGADKGTFGNLRLQGVAGTTFIKQVKIEFTNGQEQLLSSVNKTLYSGQSMDLGLDGAGRNAITRIVVYTNDIGQNVEHQSGSFSATVF